MSILVCNRQQHKHCILIGPSFYYKYQCNIVLNLQSRAYQNLTISTQFNRIGQTVVTLTAHFFAHQSSANLHQGLASHVNVVWAYLWDDKLKVFTNICMGAHKTIRNLQTQIYLTQILNFCRKIIIDTRAKGKVFKWIRPNLLNSKLHTK